MKDYRIVLAECEDDYLQAATLLTINNPWKELNRSYEYSLAKVKEENGELYVAKIDDEVIGCLVLEANGPLKTFVRALCVKEGFRNLKVGAALLKHIEEITFKKDSNVFLFCSTEAGLRFYKRNGYEEIGKIDNYNLEGEAEHILRKTIGPLIK